MKKLLLLLITSLGITLAQAQPYLDGNNDYISATSTSFDLGSSDFTIECMVNIEAAQRFSKYILQVGDGNWNDQGQFSLETFAAGDVIFGASIAGSNPAVTATGITWADGTWHHIAGVYNATGSTLTLYIDGTSVGSSTNGTATSYGGALSLTIGNRPNATGKFFPGYMKEVRVWNDIRTQTEISENMSGSLPYPADEPNLVAYYKLTDISGTTAPDSKGSLDATLILYNAGTGVSGDEYQIAYASDLIELSQHSEDWSKYFIQTADIDFGADETTVDWDGNGSADGSETVGFSPIGSAWDNQFTGSYNGNGKTISNLYINSVNDYVAMFGYVNYSSIANSIKDLGLLNVDIFSTGVNVAGLIAYVYSSSLKISNCYVTGSVSSSAQLSYVAGLIALNKGTIEYCYNSANISSTYSTTGGAYVGGLVASSVAGTIKNCFNTGTVVGDQNIGGLVGATNGTNIYNSYNTGSVSGHVYYVGGLVGKNGTGEFAYCYSAGLVTGDESSYVGGFTGNPYNTQMYYCYWDINTSGMNVSPGTATGLTTAQMKNQSTFTGWDFATPVWNIKSGNYASYPYLQGFTYDAVDAISEVNPIPGLFEIPLYYRSKSTTGDWTYAQYWEQSYDGTNWSDATNFPGEYLRDNQTISIQDGHTISLWFGHDPIVIENLSLLGSGTLEKYISAKLTVNGTLSMAANSSGGIQIYNWGF